MVRCGVPPRIARRDLALGLAFFVAWVVPIWHGALAGYPSRALPAALRDFYSISCLFSRRSEEVPFYLVELQHQHERGWRRLPEHEYFRLLVFGYRTRCDRFMIRWGSQSRAARDELARWLARRHGEIHPDAPPVVAVRFLAGMHRIDPDVPPQGRWRKPERGVGLALLSEHRFGEAGP
jgi:hypothetical protein